MIEMIEIITTTTATEEKPFPKLMTHKYMGIFFFTEPNKGLWLVRRQWYEEWSMELFEDYNEPVTLKNV